VGFEVKALCNGESRILVLQGTVGFFEERTAFVESM